MEKEWKITPTGFKILLKIFNYTDFDDEVENKVLVREIGINDDYTYSYIKKVLINEGAFTKVKKISNSDIIKIDYIKLGEVIENTKYYRLVEDFNKLKRKGKGKLNPDLS